ncbi:MAG: Gfo/Idh/MocA family oxidoreductase [Geminicoccaceae bacterium]|nr:Gfo/Idh/MocA family oxidoreductase [Geminicoccaceae bacterium]
MSLRLGWIGCGRHARRMLLPQMASAGMRVEAVCDRDPLSAAKVADAYGIGAVYSDYRQLMGHPGLDAVGMAVGPALHVEAGCAALGRGLPVFVEKPPSADAAGASRLAEASARTGLPVLLGFMKRYSTGNRMAKAILAGAKFGEVLGITATYMTGPAYFAGEPDHDGFYLHHCVHYMDLVPWLAGSEMTDMAIRQVEPGPGRLLFHLNTTFASGAIATIIMGTVQSRGNPVEHLTIMGDHQRIEVDNVIDITWYRDPPFKADDPDAILDDACDALTWKPNFTAAANEDHKGYQALLTDVAVALRGDISPAPTIADGVLAMQRLERMRALLGH